MMKRSIISGSIVLGLGLTLALLWWLGNPRAELPAVRAASYTVCPAGPPTCNYAIIQEAVDAAGEGDIIKVATGDYTDVNNYGGLAQIVYISKTVTLRGGYTAPDFADPPDPEANPTTLDAQGLGRVLYITGNISPTVEGLRITGGDAAGLGGGPVWVIDTGGGVYIITATATIYNNQVFSNTANQGGGLYLVSNNATLSSNIIISNTVHSGNGGGVYWVNSSGMLNANHVTSNTAHKGGGLYLEDSVALDGNTVTSNTASYGGGMYLGYSKAALNGNTVTSNTATTYGGGLYVEWGAPNLDGNIITFNTAYYNGGGVYLDMSRAILNGNIISANTAQGIGWVDGGGGLYLRTSPATLGRNTITANTAYANGGGLLVLYAGTLDANIISGNTAVNGGGVFLQDGFATLSGNVINDNTADYGGGLHLFNSAARLTNTVVTDNQANIAGSGLYVRVSAPWLLHTTIARNNGGDGSGLHVTGAYDNHASMLLTNTLLVSQTVGVTVTADSTATLEATLWGHGAWANGADWGGAGTIITGTVNVWGDPVFVNPGAGDYHIGPDSAAIDAGVDAGVTVDIDGEPRPSDASYDIGADEYWPAGAFKFVYLPLVVR